MVMILFFKEIVVFLYDNILPSYHFGLFHPKHDFIVNFWPFFNES